MSPELDAIVRMLAAFAVDDYLSELQGQTATASALPSIPQTIPPCATPDGMEPKILQETQHDQT